MGRNEMRSSERQRRNSYLLRIWRAGNGQAPEWRVLLEDTSTHQRWTFVSPAQLCAFLEAQIGTEERAQPEKEEL
jgi:hypothetical protein